jgi:RloB-like protein
MRKNRGYKKGAPFRDARLFVIACEGEKREKEYFGRLGQGSQRLKVRVLAPDAARSLSAPKWLLDRLINFIEKEGVNTQVGDRVWIVMDIDRWETKQLYALAEICRKEGWGFALSNPCFEVWLFMHVKDIDESTSNTCQNFKHELGQIATGGYQAESFVLLVGDAIRRAKLIPDDRNSPIPAFKVSRVYLPAEEILEMF